MDTSHFTSPATAPAVHQVVRVAPTQWHALADGQVVGRGDSTSRPDGRIFLSIDAWHRPVFDRLAAAMAADLPDTLHTLVDADDTELRSGWERAGFVPGRREWEYLVPTDPQLTGLDSVVPPGVAILSAGQAEEEPLRALDRTIREEVEATVGWHTMPAEVLPWPVGAPLPVDPANYTVATVGGAYVGLARLATRTRQARIGLIAVRADHRRRGIGRALLSHAMTALHQAGRPSARAEVHEANAAALALLDGAGATRVGGNLELVRA
ncbi:GNAT family N-acetyltransferase [Kitasatospora sp. NPDC049285]|uniref:GNAT family N-acetyltransferase n=1 Tax=Kitasatospora sp. NPDC049285 TaxID=3157096 RepID=UPI003425BEE1